MLRMILPPPVASCTAACVDHSMRALRGPAPVPARAQAVAVWGEGLRASQCTPPLCSTEAGAGEAGEALQIRIVR